MVRHQFMSRASGFSLMEVMVAVIIICVGLLGIAKMQSLSLSNTTVSRQRAVAAFEAASMASAIHANRDYWSQVPANFQVSITSNPTTVTSTDATLKGDIAAPSACIATAAGGALCTAPQLAGFDVARWWNNSLSVLLPNPSALIQCSQIAGAAAPISCQIQITWSEKAVAMNAQETAQANVANVQFQTPTYTLYVQP
jgi:type IV pilus assembly protein PilV